MSSEYQTIITLEQLRELLNDSELLNAVNNNGDRLERLYTYLDMMLEKQDNETETLLNISSDIAETAVTNSNLATTAETLTATVETLNRNIVTLGGQMHLAISLLAGLVVFGVISGLWKIFNGVFFRGV